MNAPAKFIQLAAVPATDTHNQELYALDEAGGVWWHVREEGGWIWVRIPDQRVERTREDGR